MTTGEHLIYLPYTDDLTPAGIASTCRAYTLSIDNPIKSPQRWIRKNILSTASQLAFHRYLIEQNIPFKRSQPTPFDKPQQVLIHLGGRACWLHHQFLPIEREQLHKASLSSHLLRQTVSIPLDHLHDERIHQKDLHLFVTVLFAKNHPPVGTNLHKEPQPPYYWWCPFSLRYAHPRDWKPLHLYAIRSDNFQTLMLEINGQNQNRNWVSETTQLFPGKQAHIQTSWYSLSYVHADRLPEHEIRLLFNNRSDYIEPSRWHNIWIEGYSIILTGYLAHYEIIHYQLNSSIHKQENNSHLLPAKLLHLKVKELHPLPELLDILSTWEN